MAASISVLGAPLSLDARGRRCPDLDAACLSARDLRSHLVAAMEEDDRGSDVSEWKF